MSFLLFLVALLPICAYSQGKNPFFPQFKDYEGIPYTVSYTNRSLTLNKQPVLFLSGSVHPPRSTPGTWDSIFEQAHANGLNMIEVYVMWNYHEPAKGAFNWNGRGDLDLFIQKCANNNLFVNLRIGPYVCAEWKYGGIPVWVGHEDGIKFRTENAAWQKLMKQWMQTVVDRLKKHFAPQGGPIVVAQVENELHGAPDVYVEWCGTMAHSLGAGIPWIMCNGQSASTTINTCNGNSCTGFANRYGQNGQVFKTQPGMWTEMEGGFQVWGGSPSDPTSYFWGRTTADASSQIMQWFARGGSHMNYYMYYGGNNFEFSGSSITNYYAADAPLCPDGLPHEPRYSHIGKMHRSLASVAKTILENPVQVNNGKHLEWFNPKTGKFEPGTQQFGYIYGTGEEAVAFIENVADITVLTKWESYQFNVTAHSSVLANGKGELLFDSGDVKTAAMYRKYQPTTTKLTWESWVEDPSHPPPTQPSITQTGPAEQSDVDKGLDLFLYYTAEMDVMSGSNTLQWDGVDADAFIVVIDGKRYGDLTFNSRHSGDYRKFSIKFDYTGKSPVNVTILSDNLGYDNGMGSGSGPKHKGITSGIKLNGKDISNLKFTMRPALAGEFLKIYQQANHNKVPWSTTIPNDTPITWYSTTFDMPSPPTSKHSLLLHITNEAKGLQLGEMYLNGNKLGRYWTILRNDHSGEPTQQYYPLPVDWVMAKGNQLVLMEMVGGSPVDCLSVEWTVFEPSSNPPTPEPTKVHDCHM